MGDHGAMAACPLTEGVKSPPDERKEGDNNVYYISGFDPDWYIHCWSYRSGIPDIQRQKIAATTAIVTACLL